MSEEPEIVKILKREESKGLLKTNNSQCLYEETKDVKTEQSCDLEPTISQKNDLKTIQARYNIIFENYAIGITIADENEHIFSWNKYAEELLNMKEKDLYMIHVSELYPEDEWAKIRGENIRQKGIKYRMETKMIRKEKGCFDVEISLSVLKGPGGKTVGSVGIIKDISDLKKTERKLIESEEKYKTIFENSAVAIMLTDEKERIISWNDYAEKLLNMNKDDLFLKPVESLYSKEEWAKIRGENIRQKGMQHHLETKILRKDDEPLDIDISLSVLRNHKGEIIGSIGVIKDITEQKRMKEKLEDSERKFKKLYNNAPVPYHTLSPDGIITDVNEKWVESLGFNKKEVIGKPIFDLIVREERENAEKSFKNKIDSCKSYTGGHERKYVTKDGNKRIFVIHDFLSFDKNNKVKAIHTIMEDVTKRKQAEEKITESMEKYRAIFELSPQAMVVLDKGGAIIDINQRIYDWLGYKPKDIIGKNIFGLPFLTEEGKEKIKKNFFARIKGENISPYEAKFLTKNGEERIGTIYGTVLKDKNQNVTGDLVAISDITQKHKAWEETVKSEEKYRVLAETSADGVLTIDPLGRLTYVNPSLEKMIGRRKSKILATPFREYVSESSVYLFQQIMIDVRKNDKKMENVEICLIHNEGFEVPVEANIAPLKKDGSFIGLECTLRDVSEKEKILRELKKSENLRTEFMNIAAHELKSPVTPIKGYLELIESDKESNDRIKNWARIGLRNAERLLRLVNDILDVSRLDTDTMRFNMEKIDIKEVLNDAIEDFEAEIENKNLKFIKNIPKETLKILVDKYRLSQVLKNLLGNSIKFTDFGSISISANKKDNFLYIEVEDTGIGISKDETQKVFSKFYQAYTGEDRKNEGTGLGLFICKEIIKKHNGKIWAESEVGKGSKFTIKLPI